LETWRKYCSINDTTKIAWHGRRWNAIEWSMGSRRISIAVEEACVGANVFFSAEEYDARALATRQQPM